MNIAKIQSLDKNIANDKITMPYPHLKVLDISNALALVIPSLDKGDLPVICEFEGVVRKVGSIRKSALVIKQLSKITRLSYCKSDNICIEVGDMKKLLEVL